MVSRSTSPDPHKHPACPAAVHDPGVADMLAEELTVEESVEELHASSRIHSAT